MSKGEVYDEDTGSRDTAPPPTLLGFISFVLVLVYPSFFRWCDEFSYPSFQKRVFRKSAGTSKHENFVTTVRAQQGGLPRRVGAARLKRPHLHLTCQQSGQKCMAAPQGIVQSVRGLVGPLRPERINTFLCNRIITKNENRRLKKHLDFSGTSWH